MSVTKSVKSPEELTEIANRAWVTRRKNAGKKPVGNDVRIISASRISEALDRGFDDYWKVMMTEMLDLFELEVIQRNAPTSKERALSTAKPRGLAAFPPAERSRIARKAAATRKRNKAAFERGAEMAI